MDIQQAEEAWKEASDDSLIAAATKDRDEYAAEIQAIIENEVRRRNLVNEVEQRRAYLKKNAGKKSRSRSIMQKLLFLMTIGIVLFFLIDMVDSIKYPRGAIDIYEKQVKALHEKQAKTIVDEVANSAESEAYAESWFKDRGISFTAPEQWQRWASDKEATALQLAQGAGLKVKLIHLAGWSKTDEAATLLLTVTTERSGLAVRLSDILARHKRDDNRAKTYGDVAQINCLEIGNVGGHECVVHDMSLQVGSRTLTYDFLVGPEQITIQWVFRDATRFGDLKPAVDGVLETFSPVAN